MRSPYSASKWAVVGFTKSLAVELGEYDITVNAILPGHVRPTVSAAWSPPRRRRSASRRRRCGGIPRVVSLKRNVEMDDIANMALYLASPFGRNITGQAISVCGDVQMMR